jgi:TfoX/Sxy family transcriptional regulator of competence genes
MGKKNSIAKGLKFAFGGFSLFFIGMLFFIVVYDALTGASSETTAEYCKKYGFLASPDCW